MNFPSWLNVDSYWAAAMLGFIVASIGASVSMGLVTRRNRLAERTASLLTEAPEDREIRWHIAHLRNNLGAVVVGIGFANGLLGGNPGRAAVQVATRRLLIARLRGSMAMGVILFPLNSCGAVSRSGTGSSLRIRAQEIAAGHEGLES